MQDKELQELFEKEQVRINALFENVFTSDNGKEILEILQRIVLETSPYCEDPRVDPTTDSLMREGARQLVQHINARINNLI